MQIVNRKHSPFTHYVGRGSVFGNPFTHLPLGITKAAVQMDTVESSVGAFLAWANGDATWAHIEPARRVKMLAAIRALPENAVLGCYCAPCLETQCHGYAIAALHAKLRGAK